MRSWQSNAMKEVWRERITTVFVRQGHHTRSRNHASYSPGDMSVERIGDLVNHDLPALLDPIEAGRAKEEAA